MARISPAIGPGRIVTSARFAWKTESAAISRRSTARSSTLSSPGALHWLRVLPLDAHQRFQILQDLIEVPGSDFVHRHGPVAFARTGDDTPPIEHFFLAAAHLRFVEE